MDGSTEPKQQALRPGPPLGGRTAAARATPTTGHSLPQRDPPPAPSEPRLPRLALRPRRSFPPRRKLEREMERKQHTLCPGGRRPGVVASDPGQPPGQSRAVADGAGLTAQGPSRTVPRRVPERVCHRC